MSRALFMIWEEWNGHMGGGLWPRTGLGAPPRPPQTPALSSCFFLIPPVFFFFLIPPVFVSSFWGSQCTLQLKGKCSKGPKLTPPLSSTPVASPAALGSPLWPAVTQAAICALSSQCAVSRNPRPFISLLILVLDNQLLAFTELPFLSSLLPASPFPHWSFVLLGAFPYPHVPAGAQRSLDPHFPEPFCISLGLLVWRRNIFNNIYWNIILNTYTALTIPVCNFFELQKVRSEQVWTLVYHIEILGAAYTCILNLLCTSQVPWQAIQLHNTLICEMKTMAVLYNIYPYNNNITLSYCVVALRK